MNFSSLLTNYAIYLLLTLLLFTVFRRRITGKNSSLYMFLSSVLIGFITPVLFTIFGALLTIGLLVFFSVILSLLLIYFTIRQERLATAEFEETAGDSLVDLPAYTEITETKENFIAIDASNPMEVTESQKIIDMIQQNNISPIEDLQNEDDESERLNIPKVIPAQNMNQEHDNMIEDDFILPGFAEKEILPLPESRETMVEETPVIPLTEDDEEEILRFKSGDEPIGDEQPYNEPEESCDDFPTFDDITEEFHFVGEEASTENKEESVKETKKKGILEEEDKEYLAFLGEVLEEEGLTNEDKTK